MKKLLVPGGNRSWTEFIYRAVTGERLDYWYRLSQGTETCDIIYTKWGSRLKGAEDVAERRVKPSNQVPLLEGSQTAVAGNEEEAGTMGFESSCQRQELPSHPI